MMSKFAGFALCSALAVAFATSGMRFAAAETACTSDDEAVCKAEKDERMALYTLGRNAYDTARTSGDFTEAVRVSRKLATNGDKNGERLLKMVYIQLGSGAHRDNVQAYVWIRHRRGHRLRAAVAQKANGKNDARPISRSKENGRQLSRPFHREP